jgi:myosin-7
VKKSQFYGTTFYPPCKSVNNGRKIPNKVIIGVNADGIMLLKPKDKELISTHPFTEICSWASSSTTFAFECGVQSEATKYTFETKQGAIIASTIQTYIDILVEMLTNGNEEDESTATGTSHGSEGDD